MATVQARVNTITGYNNYLGHEISAKEIENAVLVTITFYRERYGKAYEQTEFWIIPNANLNDSSYLNKTAYQVYTSVTRDVTRVFTSFRRRWRRW